MFKKAFFVLLFLLASLSQVYAAQINSQIIVESGNDQTLIAQSILERVLLKYDIRFSEEGFRELMQMFNHVHENFMLTINAFATFNISQAKRIIENEDNFDMLVNEYRNSHMSRVFQQKVQSIETSTKHMDLLGCFKRINMSSVDLAKAMTGDWHGIEEPVSSDLKAKAESDAAEPDKDEKDEKD